MLFFFNSVNYRIFLNTRLKKCDKNAFQLKFNLYKHFNMFVFLQ